MADELIDFLPHSGYASVAQFIDVTQRIVGMGLNLALFLSVYGGVIDGDVKSWSIGGTPSLAQGGVTGILGNGLIGSHNKYEGDGSPTRADLYQGGNNWMTVTEQFQDLVNASPGGEVTLESLTAFRSQRIDTQIASNPNYFYGPFSGVLVQPAAYTFIYRFMANHSAENPAGKLSYETLQSWFGVEGTNRNYNAKQGTERIPDNWYRRAIEYPYETTYFLADLINAAALHPKFLSVGGYVFSHSASRRHHANHRAATPARPTLSRPSTSRTSPAACTSLAPFSRATTSPASSTSLRSKLNLTFLVVCSARSLMLSASFLQA